MATRTVTVRLRADISNYTRGMRQAAHNTSELAGIGASVSTALVAGFAVAAASAAKFDKALSNVRAVTGASAADMDKLRTAALDAGKTTAYSATEAADAEAELARAGVSVSDIVGGALTGSLSLAAAGQIDLAEAATVAAQSMNTFGLKGKDVPHIADLLAAGANKSAADVHGLSEAMRQGGMVAHQTGLSIEDTVGILSAFADHALIGSDAGTSLKTMLQRLTPQSQEAASMMDKLGFSAYDSQGNFIGLSAVAGRMHDSFSRLSPEARNTAMNVIFGSDAVRAATVLYQLGAGGVDKYTKSVNDNGAAARMASMQMDNLMGDLQKLRGALEVALIEGGSAANGALRDMTQWVTGLVNAYNDLSPGVQHAVTLIGGIAGAVGLAASGILLLLPRIAATRAALTELGVTAARTRAAMALLGRMSLVIGGLAAVAYGVDKVAESARGAPPDVDRLVTSLKQLAATGRFSGELRKTFGDMDGLVEKAKKLRVEADKAKQTAFGFRIPVLDDVADWLSDNINDMTKGDESLNALKDDFKSLDKAMADMASSGYSKEAAGEFNKIKDALLKAGYSVKEINKLFPEYRDAVSALGAEQGIAAGKQKDMGDAAALTTGELEDQRTAAEKLTDTLKSLNGVNIDAAEQEISFQQSLADLTSAVKENGHSLDTTTAKGRKVKGAFLDAAKSAQAHAQAVAEQKNSVEAGNAVLEKDIGALKRTMRAAGFSKDAIDKLTAAYAQLPPKASTQIQAETRNAINDLEAVQKKVKNTKGKTITMKAPTKAAISELEALGFKIKRTKGKKVIITVPTGSQKANVDRLRSAINLLRNRNVKISITQYFRRVGNPQGMKNALETMNADGGIALHQYANGGVQRGGVRHFAAGSERHVAQFAPAGSWRIWAEPETGGEAYIPLALSKRKRSRAIAEETVRLLGGGPVQWFANGSNMPGRPGHGFTAAGSSRVIVVRESSPVIGSLTIPVMKTNATAYDIAAQVGRQARRARRGGAASRD